MELARDLVRDYVGAGFTKIHLDASMRLADDPTDRPLDEATVAERAADLCAVAEAAAALLPADAPRPVYVVGSASGKGADISCSIDGGKSFGKEPVKVSVKKADGTTEEKDADPKQYTQIKWVVKKVLPGKSGKVSFKAKID